MGASSVSATRLFHEETKFWPDRRRGPHTLEFTTNDPRNVPIFFKDYPDLPTIDLEPDLLDERSVGSIDALSRTSASTAALGPVDLARVLAYSAGITRTSEPPLRWWRHFPASSSAHSYPDVYVVCANVGRIDAGVYYFDAIDLQLERLREGDYRSVVAAAAADPTIARRALTIIVAGVPWRAAHAYGEKALRHVYWDVGSLLANMVALSDAHGYEAEIFLGFVDAEVAAVIGVDGVDQFPVALATFGPESDLAPQAPAVRPLSLASPPIASREVVTFPLIVDGHRAGDLHDSREVTAWRSRRRPAAAPESFPGTTPGPPGLDESLEHLILRRGTTRRFRPDPIPRVALDWPLKAAVRPAPGDWVDHGQTLLRHSILIHAVEGLQQGLYRLNGDGLLLVRPADLRDAGRFVSGRQGQGGDGAYTAFQFADLDRIFDALGARGYRAAQVEGGYVLERLLLGAFALRVGATGLGFYDEAVVGLCETDLSVMTEVAVGIPAYRAKRGRLGKAATVISSRAYDLYSERMREIRGE